MRFPFIIIDFFRCLFQSMTQEGDIICQDGIEYQVVTERFVVVAGVRGTLKPAIEIPVRLGDRRVDSIETGAFERVKEIERITFSQGTMISCFADHAFASSGLKSIVIPNTVETIYPTAFWNCLALENVEFEEGCVLNVIPDECFRNTGLRKIRIPDTVESISAMAFRNCIYLLDVEFGDSQLVVIGEGAFSGCGLERFVLPPSVRVIEESAFECCSALSEFIISETSELAEIKSMSFSETALKEIFIPKKCTYISGAFSSCVHLKKLTVSPDNSRFTVADEVLYSKSQDDVIICLSQAEEIHLVEGVSNILTAAFANCVLRAIIVPDSVRRFCDEAFSSCYALERVEFGDLSDLRWIGQRCFSCCGLQRIHIPTKVKYIGADAFHNCQALAAITFAHDSELKTIKEFAFDASAIVRVALPNSLDSIGPGCFVLSKIAEIVIGVAVIPDKAFWMCKSLDKIVLTRRNEIRIEDTFCPLEKCYVRENTVVKVLGPDGQFKETDKVQRVPDADFQLLVDEIWEKVKSAP